MFYNKHYTTKPEGFEIIKIQGYKERKTGTFHPTLLKQREFEVEDLANELVKGSTFRAGVLKEESTKQDDWISQQIYALDFDNKIEKDGTDKRTTLESEINRCKQYDIFPAFGYYSFSSTDLIPKFRLVFISDKIISDKDKRNKILDILVDKLFINSDGQVKNADRMFFGGKKLINFDFNNTFNADTLIRKYYIPNKIVKQPIKDFHKHKSIKPMNVTVYNEHINAIKHLDVKEMKELLDKESIHNVNEGDKGVPINRPSYNSSPFIPALQHPIMEVHNQSSLFECIYNIDLVSYLGLPHERKVQCIFPNHDDIKSSAHIWTTDEGVQIYKCFGCGRSGTIITMTERIAGCSYNEAIEFIKATYDIVYYESDWIKKWKDNLINYANYLDSPELKELCPNMYQLIKWRTGQMKNIILYFTTILNENNQINGVPFFSASYNQLMKAANIKKRETLATTLALFTLLNLIVKMKNSDIPKNLYEKARKIAKQNGYSKITGFYTFDQYGVCELDDSEEIAKILKENHMTIKGLSKEYVLRTFGLEKANEVYPQFKYENSKGTSEESDNATINLVVKLCDIINGQGYCLESKIRGSGKTEVQWKRSIQYILDIGKFNKVKLNKELKEKYHIDCKGYPNIIVNRQ